MRILHVSDGSIYNYDGVSTYINELLQCAENNGSVSKLLTAVPFNRDRHRKVNHSTEVMEFRRIGFLSADRFNFSLPSGMKKAMDDFNPDIVWIHTIGPLGLKAARLAKRKYRLIYSKHCCDGDLWCLHLRVAKPFRWPFYKVASAVESAILKYADLAITHTNNFEIIEKSRYFSKFRFIPPPISSRFSETELKREKFIEGRITIGFSGRIDPEKGIDKLFKAIEICRINYPEERLHLLLIGEGPEAGKLSAIYPRVELTVTGFVDDVIPFLDKIDVFVLPSETEAYSLSSLEAYSRGLTIFTTPVGYIGQNAGTLQNVFLFRTPEELAILIMEKLIPEKYSDRVRPEEFLNSAQTFSSLFNMIKNLEHE